MCYVLTSLKSEIHSRADRQTGRSTSLIQNVFYKSNTFLYKYYAYTHTHTHGIWEKTSNRVSNFQHHPGNPENVHIIPPATFYVGT